MSATTKRAGTETDGRVRHPKAVEAKDRFKRFYERLVARMKAAPSDLMSTPSDEEWTEFHALARALLLEHPRGRCAPTWVSKKDLERITSIYPDVKWTDLTKGIIKVLKANPAPLDLVRAKWYKELEQADPEEKTNKGCDIGLVWWALETAQWNSFTDASLTPDQWQRLGQTLEQCDRAHPVSKSPGKTNAPYVDDQRRKRQWGHAVLRQFVDAGGECRQQKGEQFALQLGRLWALNDQGIQDKILGLGVHLHGGRYQHTEPKTVGNAFKENRPLEHADLERDKKLAGQRRRTAGFRARQES